MEFEAEIASIEGLSVVPRLSGNRPFVIGRQEGCEVRVCDNLVSRKHVVVFARDRGRRGRDVSSNGTRAGAVLLRGDELDVAHGTPLQVGGHSVVIRPVGARHHAAPATGPLPAAALSPEPVLAAAAAVVDGALRREIHRRLLDHLDLAKLDAGKLDDPSTRPRVLAGLRAIIDALEDRLPPGADRDLLLGELADEALGLGPLERFLADPNVSEIMGVDANTIYVEMNG